VVQMFETGQVRCADYTLEVGRSQSDKTSHIDTVIFHIDTAIFHIDTAIFHIDTAIFHIDTAIPKPASISIPSSSISILSFMWTG